VIQQAQLNAGDGIDVQPVDGLPQLEKPQEVKSAVQRARIVIGRDDCRGSVAEFDRPYQVALATQRLQRQLQCGNRWRVRGRTDQDRSRPAESPTGGADPKQSAETALQFGHRGLHGRRIAAGHDRACCGAVSRLPGGFDRAIPQPEVVAVFGSRVAAGRQQRKYEPQAQQATAQDPLLFFRGATSRRVRLSGH
jgi:hypothetical protein